MCTTLFMWHAFIEELLRENEELPPSFLESRPEIKTFSQVCTLFTMTMMLFVLYYSNAIIITSRTMMLMLVSFMIPWKFLTGFWKLAILLKQPQIWQMQQNFDKVLLNCYLKKESRKGRFDETGKGQKPGEKHLNVFLYASRSTNLENISISLLSECMRNLCLELHLNL